MFMNETFMKGRAPLDQIATHLLGASGNFGAQAENAQAQPAFRRASVK
jgi:hypothetical protein